MNEHWVSVDQVAEHLGVVRDSIYRWIETKGLPAHKIGRLWKFKLSEVDDWVRGGGAQDDNEKRQAAKPNKGAARETRKATARTAVRRDD
ncbi:prophage CP4-57 regulatory protein (AlpA) [Burkholderia pseudomallei]|uniref:helix-turn-helix domain-containing protein n=1 Tax=Burkholderia pseudomallei TaxID=28450 RepID=UPI0021F78C40|nr:helix-turn-helix domain-containing protein [Burkholderia pseudomallei]MCW0080598.1 helix-turn-helix domain-containing protein [Burkholderia pseudomallei]CAJ8147459.1 prophage CP4-57 regulatory protein (AlpA) [Burkholderia pseudomallei]CAJ8196237.1 prophage CP4-57 regulatory protein (AlpA) [Burkholderia pseudomallei]CAJ8936340.1 prophage CP4-57 regulatory protein (AlpA) [Burkholderia pseudomallei]